MDEYQDLNFEIFGNPRDIELKSDDKYEEAKEKLTEWSLKVARAIDPYFLWSLGYSDFIDDLPYFSPFEDPDFDDLDTDEDEFNKAKWNEFKTIGEALDKRGYMKNYEAKVNTEKWDLEWSL